MTIRHLDVMAKVTLATGLIVAYSYVAETFMSFYSASQYEGFMMMNRMTGPYAIVYWGLISFNLILPQALWFRRVRRSPWHYSSWRWSSMSGCGWSAS